MSEGLVEDGWGAITISIPPELLRIGAGPDLQRFFDAMVYKLRRNCHKGHWNQISLDKAVEDLGHEVEELEKALASGSTSEVLMEAADVANEALIVANISLEARGV